MKLFTVGPVEPYKLTSDVYQAPFIYFRTKTFGDLVKSNLEKLSKLLNVSFDDNILYFTASGTAAMEAAIDNCFDENDKLLIINGGSFGHRFCELAKWHHIPFDSIDLQWNEQLTINHLKKHDNKKYTALLVNLHETSTGQLYDIKLISEFCKKNGLLLIVDAISTFLADNYDMDMYSIDLTIFSSQKGLCLSPGLSFAAFSKRMKEYVLSKGKTPVTYYLNFKDHFNNITRGQTPFTPAVTIMYELEKILDLIEENGLESWLNTIKQKCIYFRDKATKLGFEIPNDYHLSNMLTPLYFKDEIAHDIFITLQEKYQIYVNPCGGDLANKIIRISHIGNTNLQDFDELLEKMTSIILSIRK